MNRRSSIKAAVLGFFGALFGRSVPAAEPAQLDGMAALNAGVANQFFPHTTDAAIWANEFNMTLAKLGYQPLDPGWLISWFANAIMAGYDTARFHCQAEGLPRCGDYWPERHLILAKEMGKRMSPQQDFLGKLEYLYMRDGEFRIAFKYAMNNPQWPSTIEADACELVKLFEKFPAVQERRRQQEQSALLDDIDKGFLMVGGISIVRDDLARDGRRKIHRVELSKELHNGLPALDAFYTAKTSRGEDVERSFRIYMDATPGSLREIHGDLCSKTTACCNELNDSFKPGGIYAKTKKGDHEGPG